MNDAMYHVNDQSCMGLDAALDHATGLLVSGEMHVSITLCTDPECEPCYQEYADHQG